MGSGRGDRNQVVSKPSGMLKSARLQWGPVVVTGIRQVFDMVREQTDKWLQWGPVVVTGISCNPRCPLRVFNGGFNGVRSW